MKSCTSVNRAVSKKIESRVESVNKRKKTVKIIDDDGFTKVVNTQRIPSPTPGRVRKTPVPELRIVELVSDWDGIEVAKIKTIVEGAKQDGWKVKGPLTGPS